MSKLYIIGNGFDLWHNLPTSYREFYEFAKDILDELEEYYLFDPDVDVPWYDFKNTLGTFDADGFFDLHNEIDVQAEDFRPSFVYGLEDELAQETERHVAVIRDAFIDWVYQIDESQATKKCSSMTMPSLLISIIPQPFRLFMVLKIKIYCTFMAVQINITF